MKILKFLKDIFKEEEKEIKIKKDEEITIQELEESINKKINEIKSKEEILNQDVNSKIDLFIAELKEKEKKVEEVDIELKEKNEKIKSVVYEGRKKYLEFIERLIDNLEKAKEVPEFNRKIESINASFLRFGENSPKSYERATILIGKEMGEIRDSLKRFSTDILTLFKENQNIVLEYKAINSIKSRCQKKKENEEEIKKLNQTVEELNKKIEDNEQEKQDITEKVEKIKKSKEHLENIKLQKDIKIKEEEIRKQISDLRQLIDFKSLTSFFHSFEDKMNIIKSYKDNFLGEFNYDKGDKLIKLLNDSNLNNEIINQKIKDINNNENLLKEKQSDLKKDETLSIISDIESIKEKIENMKKEKDWAEKNTEKIKEESNENIKKIKEEAKNIQIIIKD